MTRYKKKKLSRKQLLHIFVFSIFCVLGLTVVYAALSTSLNISGSANVNQSSWGITIEKTSLSQFYIESYGADYCSILENVNCVDNYALIGNGSILQLPTLTSTSIKNFSIGLSLPDDRVGFLYKITNNGTIPAILESISEYVPSYTSTNNNDNDILWAQNNFAYLFEVFDVDSKQLEILSEGEILCPGETKYFQILFEIPEETTTVPTGSVTISNLGVDYNFVQADMSACS